MEAQKWRFCRQRNLTKFSRVFAFIIVLCLWGVFQGCPSRWNYPFSAIQLFLRRESQLPPAFASVLVLRMLRVLRVRRVSARCLRVCLWKSSYAFYTFCRV